MDQLATREKGRADWDDGEARSTRQILNVYSRCRVAASDAKEQQQGEAHHKDADHSLVASWLRSAEGFSSDVSHSDPTGSCSSISDSFA